MANPPPPNSWLRFHLIFAATCNVRIKLKRAYEDAADSDGTRVLVERLWPRGVSRDRARIDLWLKDAAPSTGLRKWFGHEPKRWQEFCRKYRIELAEHPEVLEPLHALLAKGPVTFVYGSREEKYNAAVALRQHLENGFL